MRDQVRVEKKVVKEVRCQSLNPTNQNKKPLSCPPTNHIAWPCFSLSPFNLIYPLSNLHSIHSLLLIFVFLFYFILFDFNIFGHIVQFFFSNSRQSTFTRAIRCIKKIHFSALKKKKKIAILAHYLIIYQTFHQVF